jgi:hypothetical protein
MLEENRRLHHATISMLLRSSNSSLGQSCVMVSLTLSAATIDFAHALHGDRALQTRRSATGRRKIQKQGPHAAGRRYLHIELDGVKRARCFQIMEAADQELLEEWIAHWNDLVDFEVVPVATSADFWVNLKSNSSFNRTR